jgi:methylmalonyl-CoA mutase cobalamin-binding subunit
VIVRIASEGQFKMPEDAVDRLNALDNDAVAAVTAGDEGKFHDLWGKMLELVRSEGRPVDDDELVGSDVILPPADTTFAEAAAEFTGEGLIPD